MAQKKKKRRRLSQFEKLVYRLTVLSVVLYLVGTTLLKQFNSTLNIEKQQYLNEINALKQGNELISLDVENLSDYDRIIALLNDKNISINSSNVTDLTE